MATTKTNGADLVNGNFCGQGTGFYGLTSQAGGTAAKFNTICCKYFGKVST